MQREAKRRHALVCIRRRVAGVVGRIDQATRRRTCAVPGRDVHRRTWRQGGGDRRQRKWKDHAAEARGERRCARPREGAVAQRIAGRIPVARTDAGGGTHRPGRRGESRHAGRPSGAPVRRCAGVERETSTRIHESVGTSHDQDGQLGRMGAVRRSQTGAGWIGMPRTRPTSGRTLWWNEKKSGTGRCAAGPTRPARAGRTYQPHGFGNRALVGTETRDPQPVRDAGDTRSVLHGSDLQSNPRAGRWDGIHAQLRRKRKLRTIPGRTKRKEKTDRSGCSKSQEQAQERNGVDETNAKSKANQESSEDRSVLQAFRKSLASRKQGPIHPIGQGHDKARDESGTHGKRLSRNWRETSAGQLHVRVWQGREMGGGRTKRGR
mmetsp:Transcript_6319/g.39389  ORF Transcript_6319/g.39389 Transcript_6319/m.39389 type:complete len:378 (-) Transcript_6319:1179-2312(-)